MSKVKAMHEKLIAKRDSLLVIVEANDKKLKADLGRELEWTDFCDTAEFLAFQKASSAVETFEQELIQKMLKQARKKAPMAYISLLTTMRKEGVALGDMMLPKYRKDLLAWSLELAS